MYCRYCIHFQESKVSWTEERNKRKVLIKVCRATNEQKEKTTESCERFEPNLDSFLCDKAHHHFSFAVCSARQRNDRLWPECQRCSQGEIVKEIRRSIRPGTKVIPEEISQEVMKPRLVKIKP